jgi:hypothetical protein
MPPTEAPRRADRPRTAGAAVAPPLSEDEPTLEDERRSPWQRVSRLVILAMIAGIVVMWFYAFFGEVPAPARLEDRTFPDAAEPVCARARADIGRLPRAFETTDNTARADVVDRATDRLTAMAGELRAVVPAAQPTRDRLNRWLDDWDTYLRDRRDYTTRLRADRFAKFYVSQSERDRRQINSSLDNFAKVNAMASCAVPEDVV